MQNGGIRDAYALLGGYDAWRDAGLPLDSGVKQPAG
jgi:3-mercaptopyruvate sulfurtransferase SseA